MLLTRALHTAQCESRWRFLPAWSNGIAVNDVVASVTSRSAGRRKRGQVAFGPGRPIAEHDRSMKLLRQTRPRPLPKASFPEVIEGSRQARVRAVPVDPRRMRSTKQRLPASSISGNFFDCCELRSAFARELFRRR